jgi:hypothetical protein
MNKKLTLLLDEKIIKQAKQYAEKNNQSLSGMVEKYFKYVSAKISTPGEKEQIPPDIEELIGIISIPESLNVKAEYRKQRAERIMHD